MMYLGLGIIIVGLGVIVLGQENRKLKRMLSREIDLNNKYRIIIKGQSNPEIEGKLKFLKDNRSKK